MECIEKVFVLIIEDFGNTIDVLGIQRAITSYFDSDDDIFKVGIKTGDSFVSFEKKRKRRTK